jgi:two-component system phosphate regulon sensor histidine kinase PhoR
MGYPELTPNASANAADWSATIARAALHASQELMLALDTTGAIRYANPAALTALHSSPEQLIGARFLDLLDPGSRGKGQRLLEQATEVGAPEFELNQIAADGQIVMIGYRAVRLPEATTEPTDTAGWLLIGRPLAGVVAATERLIGLNQRLSALFTIAAAASRSLVLTDLLQQALSMALSELQLQAGAIFLAATPIELPDAQPHDLEPGQLTLAVQQGFAPRFVTRLNDPSYVVTLWQRQAQPGAINVSNEERDECGVQPEDLLSAVGPLLTSATVPLTSERQPIGWLYVITDRYRGLQADEIDLLHTIGNLIGAPVANARLHDELLQTSGRLQAVLDNIDSGVLLVDPENIVRYANMRLGALLNQDVRDWPGQPRAAVMPPTLTLHSQPSALFDGDLWEFPGPPRRILRRFAEQVHDSEDAPIGSIEVYSDVTQLQEMNRLKDEFVAGAAHDLKTPVTAVKGYAQIALRLARRMDDERLVQQLAMINARSDELTLLMDALLDMSRIQAGRLLLDLDTFTLGELTQAVLNHFEFDLRRKKRTVAVEMSDPALEVVWDRIRMHAVLINLIGNALKYSPEGGPIELGVRTLDDQSWIELTVTDHGIGIPPEERARVFDRFYRVRAAIEHGFKGTGIGLYIARFVVELHGGRIWAGDALHGGPGVTMHVELPRTAPRAQES